MLRSPKSMLLLALVALVMVAMVTAQDGLSDEDVPAAHDTDANNAIDDDANEDANVEINDEANDEANDDDNDDKGVLDAPISQEHYSYHESDVRRPDTGSSILDLERRKIFKNTYRSWGSWSTWKIPRRDKFPYYYQTKCCGCLTGCGPVAWALVFGYYDRLAHISDTYGYSKELFRCFNGEWGSPACIAPKDMNQKPRKRIRNYIKDIRKEVKTKCKKGQGSTNAKGMGKIQTWYRARQGLQARISSYWTLFNYNLGLPRKWIRKRAAKAIKNGYPVVVGFWSNGKKGRHLAPASMYRRRSRKWRRCFRLFKKWFCIGKWKTQEHEQFWMHMGWKSKGKDGWWNLKPYAAFVARR